MPISQKTILALYGDLCDLAEKLETLANQATQPGLFDDDHDRDRAVIEGVLALDRTAKDIQRMAIGHIMLEAPEYEVNPVTGRLDE
jgi:hypothetical protein